ncbi:MAG: hypothetical protein JW751_19225 [Polyangiaceae bacterium]|nr:hypothetical protein [Polyangiaceae bacterium]
MRLTYYEHRLPLGPRTLAPILGATCEGSGLTADDPDRQKLESILSAMRNLPERHERTADLRRERRREKEVIKRRLRGLVATSRPLAEGLEQTLRRLNGDPSDPSTFDALDALLAAQSYRLASWRVAAEEINYRRFFGINELAAIRMESTEVFETAHALLFRLLEDGVINALRLDPTDGLYDPLAYFEALQARFRRPSRRSNGSPNDLARPLPILVEKILEPGEQLPGDWPVDGTTGYDFAAAAIGLLVDTSAERSLTAVYERFTGDHVSYAGHVYQSKLQILRYSLASQVNMLARSLERIASLNRHFRDFTLISLTSALQEVLAAFLVYRTYLRERQAVTNKDERRVCEAIGLAQRRNPATSQSVFDFLVPPPISSSGGTARRSTAGGTWWPSPARSAKSASCAASRGAPTSRPAAGTTSPSGLSGERTVCTSPTAGPTIC